MIQRLPTVIQRAGRSRSSIYSDVQRGVFPKPIKLGLRSIGWIAKEVDTILDARIAGESEDDIRELVILLEGARLKQRFAE